MPGTTAPPPLVGSTSAEEPAATGVHFRGARHQPWSTHPRPPARSTERGTETSSERASAGRRSHRCLPRAMVHVSQPVHGAGQGTTGALGLSARGTCQAPSTKGWRPGATCWGVRVRQEGEVSSHPKDRHLDPAYL